MKEIKGTVIAKTAARTYQVESLDGEIQHVYFPKGSKVLPKKHELIAGFAAPNEGGEDSDEETPYTLIKYLISIDKSNENVDRLISIVCGMNVKTPKSKIMELIRYSPDSYWDALLKTYIPMNDFRERWYSEVLARELELYSFSLEDIKHLYSAYDHRGIIDQLYNSPYSLLTLSTERMELYIKDFNFLFGGAVFNKDTGKVARFIKNEELFEKHHTYCTKSQLEIAFKEIDDFESIYREITNDYYGFSVIQDRVYAPSASSTESAIASNIANKLTNLFAENCKFYEDPDVLFSFTEEQLSAISTAVENPVALIVGPAGSGKTTIITEIVRQLKKNDRTYVIVSFTGKAVRIIQKRTKIDNVKTIHKCMHLNGTEETIIIDEISMCSMQLLRSLLNARKNSVKQLIFIGDQNQLPPIEWSSVVWPFLKTTIPIAYLTENHRTKTEEGIENCIVASARSLYSSEPKLTITDGGNIKWYKPTEEVIEKLLTMMHSKGIPVSKWKIITPLNKDVIALNSLAQSIYNPGEDDKKYCIRKNTLWKVGDRVVLGTNTKTVKNGEEGDIIDVTEEGIVVDFNDLREVSYVVPINWTKKKSNLKTIKGEELDEKDLSVDNDIKHGWALTVHKAQGSEWENVIAYLPYYFDFINKNLLHVMITRASKNLFLLSYEYVIDKAIENELIPPRETLSQRINDRIKFIEAERDQYTKP